VTTLADTVRRARLVHAGAVAAGGLAAVAVAVAVGALSVREPVLGLAAAAAVLAVGLTLAEPALVPVLAVPAILAVPRVGTAALDMSFSDAALFVATWPAVFLGARPYSRTMRNLLWAVAAYEALTFLSVLSHPYRANLIEWVHQLFLLAGALIMGWAIGRRGLAAVAYTLLVVAGGILTTAALFQAVEIYRQGTFAPVYLEWPWAMHKNALGTTLAMIAIGLYARPAWLPWRPRVTNAALVYLSLGIAVSQSRQAIVGFAVMAVVVAFRDGRRRSLGWLTLLAGSAVVAVSLLVRDQFASGNEHNSAYQRLEWYTASIDVWRESPWLGLGNRWWYVATGEYRFQPPQVFVEVLTTTGVVGLVAFVLLMSTLLLQLWRMPLRYGLIGFVAVASRLVQGQFDIFWVAVQSSLPFLIAGLALGAHEYHRERHPHVETETDRQAPVEAAA
jgi:hypothetical protein